MLSLNEIFYSIQGEGFWVGTPAVFIRFAGCNLSCGFCDTDYSLKFILPVDEVVKSVYKEGKDCPMVILTGGEPTIQTEIVDLIEALLKDGRRVHIESNGTTVLNLPQEVWLTVSPKERVHPLMAMRANEAKLIVDERVPNEWIKSFSKNTLMFLQPEGNKKKNIELALESVKAMPGRLRLSLQTHKFIGIR